MAESKDSKVLDADLSVRSTRHKVARQEFQNELIVSLQV